MSSNEEDMEEAHCSCSHHVYQLLTQNTLAAGDRIPLLPAFFVRVVN